ncbi:hypothetical protein [Rariglobus hedericola]|uniref:AsmA domain-containing protein n=1 Tax=Rariglobus hedericola TaxID=2597822 RepID=A0A556QIY2_9BACT|nr:hypothetical protein [Rariglobus hedericola]TSJ76589.1 hypothetical protein FPL22_10690 [Rariglobus hedericola]
MRIVLRRLLITCAAGALLLALVLAVLRVPAVQTWLAKRLVARQPGWSLEADRIDVGPGGLEAHGIDFAMPGLTAKSAPISVRVRPSRLLRREFVVEQVSINQLNIEITPAELATRETGATADPFTGVLELLQAPLSWTVAQTDINARVGLREGGHSVMTGDLKLTGGNLAPGSPGTFHYDFTAASVLLPAGPENVIRSQGTVRIVQNDTRGIASIELKGDLHLPRYGAFTPPPATLSLLLENTPSGERYRADIRFGDEALLTLLSAFNPKDKYTGFDLQFTGSPAFFARLDPRLAQLGSWQARVISNLDLQKSPPVASKTRVTLSSETTPFRFSLAQDDAAHSAHVELSGLPLSWANAWLTGTDAQLKAGGSLGGAWNVVLKDDQATLIATPSAPLTIGPVAIESKTFPSLLPVTFTLSPHLTLSKESVSLRVDDFTASTEKGDRIESAFHVTHSLSAPRTQTTGTLTGALPTLLAGPDNPLPFLIAARWDATLDAGVFQIAGLEFTARQDPVSAPMVSLALQQPIRVGSTPSVAALKTDPSQDLLRFTVNALPLAWASRWLPSIAVDGTWSRGESTLRHATDGEGFVLATRLPWSFEHLRFALGGNPVFDGSATFAPDFTYSDTRQSAEVRALHIETTDGNRLDGSGRFAWEPKTQTYTTALSLDASLPALPHSKDTFGALTVGLRAEAGTASGAVSQITHLDLTVRNATGPLLTVTSDQPVYFVQKPSGETVFNTLAPVRIQTTSFPLSWAKPWLPPGMDASGTLGATDLLLHAEPQKFRLRPVKPLKLEGLTVAENGTFKIKDARLSFFPGADVLVLHQLHPAFQLAYKGTLHATDGSIDVAGKRAAEFEGAFSFIGNDSTLLPQSIDAQTRVDLGTLGRSLDGQLVARLNGDLLGGEPLDFWARIDGVHTGAGTLLPALEIGARGKVDGNKREAGFDVGINYLTAPAPSNAAFRMTLALDRGTLSFDSALRSRFLDVTAVLDLMNTLQGAAGAREAKPVTTVSHSVKNPPATGPSEKSARLGTAFWSVLRGRFDLELGAVQFSPYRIDDVRGRLDLTENQLRLSGLTGTMFAGKWSGGLTIDYNPQAEADHFLRGEFHIAQFETARVVQTVFPNEFGSFDARINFDAKVRADGTSLWALLDNAEGEFQIEGRDGVARITHPAAGTASTLLVLGGAVSFSPELRALGRLLRKFAEMPVDALRVSGGRDQQGNITLAEFLIDSPQARISGRGSVPSVEGVALAGRPLNLSLELFARDEMSVILGNMKLLEKHAGADGYRKMLQPFSVIGEVGRPDASPLYDLLAKAATGSRGTWGFIMRKVQREVEKQRPKDAKKSGGVS